MAEMNLQLAEGRNVPLEDGRPWPVEGATSTVTHYIRRRLADGDLIEMTDPVTAPQPTEDAPEIMINSNEDTARKPVKTGGNRNG